MGTRGSGSSRRSARKASPTDTANRPKASCTLRRCPRSRLGPLTYSIINPLTIELMQLERRTARSGRDSVDHPPGAHDDLANSVCGCLALLAASERNRIYLIPITGF